MTQMYHRTTCHVQFQASAISTDAPTTKSLDKELPWRVIVEKGGDYLAEFIKAAQDEEKSWMRFGSVEPIDQKTADQIMSTAKGRKRVLRSRAAYRDKAKGCGPLRAKARVVALGCLDPDLYTLARESATPLRQSEMLVYAIFISWPKQEDEPRWCSLVSLVWRRR